MFWVELETNKPPEVGRYVHQKNDEAKQSQSQSQAEGARSDAGDLRHALRRNEGDHNVTNPREALTRAVNRAIEEGAPVYENQPDLIGMPTLGKTESGGEIKMRRTLRAREGLVPAEIVLCHLPHNNITPFVTWQRNTEEFESTYWGHYFFADEAEKAVEDFFKRGTK